jgi:hypothetical protein
MTINDGTTQTFAVCSTRPASVDHPNTAQLDETARPDMCFKFGNAILRDAASRKVEALRQKWEGGEALLQLIGQAEPPKMMIGNTS